MKDPRDTRVCEQCGAAYTRPPRTPRSVFVKRRFCSAACNGLSMRKARPVRYCGWCGTPFTPTTPTTQACSIECATKWNGAKRKRASAVTRIGQHVVERVDDADSRYVAIVVDGVEVARTTGNNYHSLRRAVISTIERLVAAA